MRAIYTKASPGHVGQPETGSSIAGNWCIKFNRDKIDGIINNEVRTSKRGKR